MVEIWSSMIEKKSEILNKFLIDCFQLHANDCPRLLDKQDKLVPFRVKFLWEREREREAVLLLLTRYYILLDFLVSLRSPYLNCCLVSWSNWLLLIVGIKIHSILCRVKICPPNDWHLHSFHLVATLLTSTVKQKCSFKGFNLCNE